MQGTPAAEQECAHEERAGGCMFWLSETEMLGRTAEGGVTTSQQDMAHEKVTCCLS